MRGSVYLATDPVTGKAIRKWASGSTQKELDKKLDIIKMKYAAGKMSAKEARFGPFAEIWLDAKYPVDKTNKNTRREQAGAVKQLVNAFGHMKFSQLRQIQIEQYLAKRGSRTAVTELRVMQRICKSAIKNKYMAEDPTDELKVTYSAPEKRELDPFERKAILTAKLRPEERAFLYLTLRCGLRKGEAIALDSSDITDRVRINKAAIIDQKGMIIADQPKTVAGNRSVPIPKDAIGEIQSYAKTVPIGKPLFGQFKRTRYWRFWNHIKCMVNDAAGGVSHFDEKKRYRVIDETAIRAPFSAHIMRHTYCTDLIRAGYRVDQIMYLMGHSSPLMTLKIYNQVKHQGITAGKMTDEKPLKPNRNYRILSFNPVQIGADKILTIPICPTDKAISG